MPGSLEAMNTGQLDASRDELFAQGFRFDIPSGGFLDVAVSATEKGVRPAINVYRDSEKHPVAWTIGNPKFRMTVAAGEYYVVVYETPSAPPTAFELAVRFTPSGPR